MQAESDTTSDVHPLDVGKRLRESLLWELQTSFYEQNNIRCWSEAIVPNYVTSNAVSCGCVDALVRADRAHLQILLRSTSPRAMHVCCSPSLAIGTALETPMPTLPLRYT